MRIENVFGNLSPEIENTMNLKPKSGPKYITNV